MYDISTLRRLEVLCGSDLGVAVGAALPHGADRLLELVVARVRAEDRAEVVAADGEEAGVELPVGREPRARAVAAERLRDRGDDADLARAVEVAVALRDLAAVRGLDRLERELGADRGDDLGGGHDIVHPPAVRRADVHELDEAHGVARPAEAAGDVEDRASFRPRLTTTLTFTGRPASAAASIPASTRATGKSTSFIARNTSSSSESRLTVMRVSPASRERLRLLREQRARSSSA